MDAEMENPKSPKTKVELDPTECGHDLASLGGENLDSLDSGEEELDPEDEELGDEVAYDPYEHQKKSSAITRRPG